MLAAELAGRARPLVSRAGPCVMVGPGLRDGARGSGAGGGGHDPGLGGSRGDRG